MNLSVQRASLEDANAIVELLREGIGDKLINYTIAGTVGMVSFVSTQLADDYLGPNIFFVCKSADQIKGFAEVRIYQNELFLNHIYVSEQFRGNGLGRALLHSCLDFARVHQLKSMGLDVFTHNEQAKKWYEFLGFKIIDEYAWLEVEIPCQLNQAGNYIILNQPFANAVYDKFGFASVEIETNEMTYSVGLLGARLFRINTSRIFDDVSALTALMKFDPLRKILCIDKVSEFNKKNIKSGKVICGNYRMSVDVIRVI